ncbi:hypothetical protein [Tersicoccus sp. Bi-70]|uniref:hypothetical protein n=1 Tax=Tersicoccus sp. Bi-70 TaxID=1897634 RepID=UPI000975BADB|nr:hypothetical protein [Tersicoccus sp. Bi-70]OMH34896.1 hypothetical protein BGP79_00580 [Tersicoccus sp. Bi-70]
MMNDDLPSPDTGDDELDGHPRRRMPVVPGVHDELSRAVRFGQVTQEQADRFEQQLARLGHPRV